MIRLILVGNLMDDPVLKTVKMNGQDTSVAEFTVVVNPVGTRGKDEKGDFFKCVAWRGLGTSIATYGKKQRKIYIEARPKKNDYEIKKGNETFEVKGYEWIVDAFEFVDKKPEENGNSKPYMNTSSDDAPF